LNARTVGLSASIRTGRFSQGKTLADPGNDGMLKAKVKHHVEPACAAEADTRSRSGAHEV
jgi:hypothetical protein